MENTWEPESHVTNCRKLIDEFEKKNKTPIGRRNRRTKRRISNQSSSLSTGDEDDSIVQVRRNPRTKRIEYEVQQKNSEKKLWISSDKLIETHAFQLVEFFEKTFLQ